MEISTNMVAGPSTWVPGTLSIAPAPARNVPSTAQRSEQSTEQYPYLPLPPTSRLIRLLVLRASQTPESVIQCDIVSASLGDNPKYTAISYVWGPPEPSRLIRIGGRVVKVRQNLFALLNQLRSDSENPLWIDALCINQEDISERNSQVQLMGDIYSNAEYVISWLGEESDDSKSAFKLIRLLCPPVAPVDDEHNSALISAIISYLTSDKPEYEKYWIALENLLARDYWSRVWVTQELLLARNVVLVCGTDADNWSALSSVLALLDAPISSDVKQDSRRHIPLSMWLAVGRQRKATDERDKVFAVLGLPRVRTEYRADYHKERTTVFREITQRAIEQERNLDVLSCSGSLFNGIQKALSERTDAIVEAWEMQADYHNSHDETHSQPKSFNIFPPSWTPDWTWPYDWGDQHSLVVNLREEPCYFRAAGDSVPRVRYVGSQEIMISQGVFVDIIASGHPGPGDAEASGKLRYRLEWESWQENSNVPHDIYGDLVASRLAFKSTAVVGRTCAGAKQSFTAEHFNIEDDEAFGLPNDGPLGVPGGSTQISSQDLFDGMKSSHFGRRFFVTESGYIGRGPQRLRTGDIVVVLLGGKVPFILRPDVHGIMDGEVMEEIKAGKRDLKEFTLI
ncbi:heterokaryon incompatibility protein-domain-containing protein [Cercophora newfieldiana]|uniref:Heterokaryon incompatibility protein-domain-containing protein n=1 Tax=Cercophora newfieldiana TaxID=92897 RepID=A0AA40CRW9_9PEZI|nr:heterokaryon incompatibility protein-domain-containing protein [Cercophora newfieldiana]